MNSRFSRLVAPALLGLAIGPMLVLSASAGPLAKPAERSDATLVSAVKDALSNDMGKAASDLAITARDGKITLHGWVNSPKQEAHALDVAAKVPGVRKAYSNVHTWSSRDDE